MPAKFKLLVCDLDNTLYDWVSYFVPSFYAMVDKVVEITGVNKNALLDDFRGVHQKYKDSEHPFALLETQIIRRYFLGMPQEEMLKALDPAFHAFNSNRKKHLRLHDGVENALAIISESGTKIVAHTESKLYGAIDRITRLEIDKYFSRVYCRERPSSIHPKEGHSLIWLDQFPSKKIVELSHHQTKPNPDVLREICRNEGCLVSETAYVGDSMARDILMAKKVGVFAIWAAYGAKHSEELYEKLVRISHWSPDDVSREKQLNREAAGVRPDFIAKVTFGEILSPLELRPSRSETH